VSPGAAAALRGTLVVFAALRLAALITTSMALWGLDAGRFTSFGATMALWLLPALALVPALGEPLDVALDRLARAIPRRAVPGLVALAAALLVFLLPDRVWFVGDFLLREGGIRMPGDFRLMFPQAQPLDVWLHHALPQALLARGVDTTLTARLVGAVEAGLLALLGVRFVAGLGLRGAPAFAAGSVVIAGGFLALFAGYSKPTIEVTVLAVATGVFGVETIRGGRSFLPAALAFAAALGFHRSALGLLPGLVVMLGLALRRHGLAPRRGEKLAALAVLALTLALFLPGLWRLFNSFDLATNFVSAEVRQQGGPLAAAFTPLRLLDLANLMLLHVPLALALPLLLAARPAAGAPDRAVLGALAALFAGHLPALLFVYVTQGPFRDWDANAGAFAALALLVATGLARQLAAGSRRGLASAAGLATLCATLTLIVAQHDLEGGLLRAHAFLAGPPERTPSQRLATLDWLGLRYLRLERFEASAAAFSRLSADAPHPRALVLEGTASLLADRPDMARGAFTRLTERDVRDPLGWFGLWLTAVRSGDSLRADTLERHVLAWPDSGPEMTRVMNHLEHYPGLWDLLPRSRAATPPGAP
jgi:hypothetical protein